MSNPLINTIAMEWIVFGISVLIGVLSLLAQFLDAGNYTPAAIISFVVAILILILNKITKNEQAAIEAKMLRKEEQIQALAAKSE